MVLPTLLGKIEFEMGEEGRERAVLDHLLRLAVAATFRDRLSGLTSPASPTSSPRADSWKLVTWSRHRICWRSWARCRALYSAVPAWLRRCGRPRAGCRGG